MRKLRSPILLSASLVLWLSGASCLLGQNLLDEQGRKTGPWKVDYPNGKTLYEATFKDGRPVGLMVRYYENGAVRARMKFDPFVDRSFTTLYYKNGKSAAEGWYEGKAKDSVWTYFSEFDGSVRIREPYVNGMLHGRVQSYYPEGHVSEEVFWVQNNKKGSWKQFYKDGSLRLDGSYDKDMLNGLYQVYYADSTIKVSGTYVDNLSHGIWSYYNEEGEELYTIEFQSGRAVDQAKYLEIMQDTLKKFELTAEPDHIQHL
ncbi:MAG: toxin-antitoxin system YwqK family antitoxin [Bacteroidales bacterium]|nr:toxin-antitoxin system YwqK family antitoxin [Bacteroidales bacterium]